MQSVSPRCKAGPTNCVVRWRGGRRRGGATALQPWWGAPGQHLRTPGQDRSSGVKGSWSPNSTVLHLDIYLCKYTNLKDTAGQSANPPHTPPCFGGRNNGNVDKRNLPKKFKPLEGGQFRFWSNLKVPFMYTCGINHFFRIFNPTFDEWKSRFGVQSSHKRDLKKQKKNCPPQPLF